MSENHITAFLKDVPLFSQFAAYDLAKIAGSFQTRTYRKLSVLAREGETAELSVAGKETMLFILKEGDVFGEMGLIDAEPRSAMVRALSVAQVAILARDNFLALLEVRPQMNRVVVSALAARLRTPNLAIRSASYFDTRSKVVDLLLMLEQNFGERIEGGARLRLRLTTQDMAIMVGLSRESVNRMLNRLRDENCIDMSTPHIVVRETLKLATKAA